jgi:23S rRNA-/tRNA-specific pseudouridylate synthase
MPARDCLTFPAGVLGAEPARLPVLARGDDWIALAKPAGVSVGSEALEPTAADLLVALQGALAAGKPQLLTLGITHAGRVHHIDAAATGVVVLALGAGAEARLRNDVGSHRWEFVFDVLAEANVGDEATPLTCDLPLVRHASEPRMVVSHATGRKCATTFGPVRSLGRWALWEARTRDNRPHQIRVHARESGLRIPGENTYGRVPRVFLSQLRVKYRAGRDDERPLHPGLAVHLREIVFTGPDQTAIRVVAEPPKSFAVLLRRLADSATGVRQLRF